MNSERKARTMNASCESEYDFALILTGITEATDEVASALYQAGCDDATVSVRSGRVYVTFSRTAPSVKEAIVSAIRDVRAANIGADVLRVDECNLVTQSEIAKKSGRSRQQIHQFIIGTRGPGGFPPPACNICDEHPLWYWCEVSYWLWQNDMLKEDAYRVAETIDVVNNTLELQNRNKITKEQADQIMASIET